MSVRLKVDFKRGKANYLTGADLIWHRWVASIGKSLTLARVCATPTKIQEDMQPLIQSPGLFYKGRSQEKTPLQRLQFFLLLSPFI